MSLKEWKNNEINTKLMKKWGLLKEGCPHEDEGQAIDISGPGVELQVDDVSQLPPEEAFAAGIAVARDAIDQLMGGPQGGPQEGEELEEGCPSSNFDPGGDEVVADEEEEGLEEGEAKWKAMADAPDDPTDAPTATALQQKRTKKRGEWGQKVRGKSGDQGKRSKSAAAGSRNVMTMGEGDIAYRDDDEEEVERRIERPYWGRAADPYHFAADSAEWPGTRRHDDQMDALEQPRGRWRGRGPGFRNRPPKRSKNVAGTKWQTAPTIPDLEPVSERSQKISVKEAKEITRRIIERVRKEGK